MFVAVIETDSELVSSSQSRVDAEHPVDLTHDAEDHITASRRCSQHHHQYREMTDDVSKHRAVPNCLAHNNHHCLAVFTAAADVDDGNHGNRQDADDSAAQYTDGCHSDGTCTHADWWKPKVTCH